MSNTKVINDFEIKFNELNNKNKQYILAISHALLFSQKCNEKDKSNKLA